MNPTPEQVARWARDAAAAHGHTIKWTDEIRDLMTSFATIVAAWQAEQDAKVCDVTPPYPFRPSIEAAHAIRANAPKVTT